MHDRVSREERPFALARLMHTEYTSQDNGSERSKPSSSLRGERSECSPGVLGLMEIKTRWRSRGAVEARGALQLAATNQSSSGWIPGASG